MIGRTIFDLLLKTFVGIYFSVITKGHIKMGVSELLILSVGLSMDAFAVSVCKGLSLGRTDIKEMALAGVWFGGFQALMPLLGYFLGIGFSGFAAGFSHWIAFILLSVIGGNMIKESFGNSEEDYENSSMKASTMFLLAVATSIDALAVGVTFAFFEVKIAAAVLMIGVVAFLFSAAGIKIGSIFGAKYRSRAELIGGVILVLLGIKILLEGLGVFG